MRRWFILIVAFLSILSLQQEAFAVDQPRPSRLLRFLLPHRIPSAVTFDGKTSLGYQGSLFGIPDTSTDFFANLWIRVDTIQQSQTNLIAAEADPASSIGNEYTALLALIDNGAKMKVSFFAACPDPQGIGNWFYAESAEGLPRNGVWQSITMDVHSDGQNNPSVRMVLNGDQILTTPIVVNNNGRCAFDWRTVKAWSVGGDYLNSISASAYFRGDMAELMADMTGRLGVNDTPNFVAQTAAGPKALGTGRDGIRPLGDIPNLLMRGASGPFKRGPTDVGFSAYEFSTNNGGDLLTAKSDPCSVRGFSTGCAPTN